MNRAVVGFLGDEKGRVLMLQKAKPDWQRGKWNGVGGKADPDDINIHHTMEREWNEEVGIDVGVEWDLYAVWSNRHIEIFFFRATVPDLDAFEFPAFNDVGEKLEVFERDGVTRIPTLPNINWLLPLAFTDYSVFVMAREKGVKHEAH
jgi:8-oxo-dGTP diphosphatase